MTCGIVHRMRDARAINIFMKTQTSPKNKGCDNIKSCNTYQHMFADTGDTADPAVMDVCLYSWPADNYDKLLQIFRKNNINIGSNQSSFCR